MIVVLKYSLIRPHRLAISPSQALSSPESSQKRALTPTLYINCSPLLRPPVCETVAKADTLSVNGMLAPSVTSTQFLS